MDEFPDMDYLLDQLERAETTSGAETATRKSPKPIFNSLETEPDRVESEPDRHSSEPDRAESPQTEIVQEPVQNGAILIDFDAEVPSLPRGGSAGKNSAAKHMPSQLDDLLSLDPFFSSANQPVLSPENGVGASVTAMTADDLMNGVGASGDDEDASDPSPPGEPDASSFSAAGRVTTDSNGVESRPVEADDPPTCGADASPSELRILGDSDNEREAPSVTNENGSSGEADAPESLSPDVASVACGVDASSSPVIESGGTSARSSSSSDPPSKRPEAAAVNDETATAPEEVWSASPRSVSSGRASSDLWMDCRESPEHRLVGTPQRQLVANSVQLDAEQVLEAVAVVADEPATATKNGSLDIPEQQLPTVESWSAEEATVDTVAVDEQVVQAGCEVSAGVEATEQEQEQPYENVPLPYPASSPLRSPRDDDELMLALHFDENFQRDERPPDGAEQAAAAAGGSLIASTHHLDQPVSVELTEAERQLGKIKPYWIPDPDSPCCLICLKKFTILRRRHHCRSCGRVLCVQCTSTKARLPYLQGREAKVCLPCATTLQRIETVETELPQPETDESQHDEASAQLHEEGTSCGAEASSAQLDGQVAPPPKAVTFGDGVRPGGGSESEQAGSPMLRPRKRRPGRSGARLAEIRLRNEMECLLPALDETGGPFQVVVDGQTHSADLEWLRRRLIDGEPIRVAVKRNLAALVRAHTLPWSRHPQVWTFTSSGLRSVGSVEVVILLERSDDEQMFPADVFHFFDYLYEQALKGNQPSDLHSYTYWWLDKSQRHTQLLGCSEHAGFLLCRPVLQSLEGVDLPTEPFLIGVLFNRFEEAWAKLLPLRLLLRMGHADGVYPWPIVSRRNRPAVFAQIGHTIMNLFADFRSYSFALPLIQGSSVSIRKAAKCTLIRIPKSQRAEVARVIGERKDQSMLAWAAAFDVADADSHLVCVQDLNTGQYSSQLANIDGRDREVTGATFVVVNGGLKANETEAGAAQLQVSEDGVRVALSSDQMDALLQRLQAGEDFDAPADGGVTLRFEWTDTPPPRRWPKGARVSQVDGRLLEDGHRVTVRLGDLVGGTDAAVAGGGGHWLRLAEMTLCDWPLDWRVVANEDELAADLWHFARALVQAIAQTLAPFVDSLERAQKSVLRLRWFSVRLRLGPDCAEYETGAWGSEGSELDATRQLWASTLDDRLVPILWGRAADHNYTATLELVMALVDLN